MNNIIDTATALRVELARIRRQLMTVRADAIRQCLDIIEPWRKRATVLLRAGEMTAAELRAVNGVVTSIYSAIYALIPEGESNCALLRANEVTNDGNGRVWRAEEVLALWHRQGLPFNARSPFHPYTCANRGDGDHETIGSDLGMLVPTVKGWICPFCDYRQEWAHATDLGSDDDKQE
jgi:hypothetical protein